MILFILLLMTLAISTIFAFVTFGTGAIVIAVLFGDVIVFVWIIVAICKRLFGKKK